MAGFLAEEVGQFLRQFEVLGASAVGQAGSGGGGPPTFQSFAASFQYLGVVGEAEVVVAGEHEVLPSFPDYAGAALAFKGVVVDVVLQPEAGGFVRANPSPYGIFVLLEKRQGHERAE